MSLSTICSNAILIWYTGLLPSLLPFMILSNIIVKMHFETYFVKITELFLSPIYKLSSHANYVITAGFLFGFPMGAKVIGQLYEDKRLSRDESMYLLSFCNHLSPIYMLTYVLPVIKLSSMYAIKYIGVFYGVPLIYGLILRYTYYKKRIPRNAKKNLKDSLRNKSDRYSFCCSLDISITDALISIAKMGGYMVAFSAFGFLCKYIITAFLSHFVSVEMLYCNTFALFEISAGLAILPHNHMTTCLSLLFATFGGLSCIFQTRSVLRNTDITLKPYVVHKIINCIVIALIYQFTN